MFGRSFGNGKQVIGFFKIFQGIEPRSIKEFGPGRIEVFQIISMPHHSHGIQVIKRNGELRFVTFKILVVHRLLVCRGFTPLFKNMFRNTAGWYKWL
jgi:hypothetical protein